MSSILTNNSAMVALQTLKSINSDLSSTQEMISTGKEVGSARDNSAVWAISKVMESDVKGFQSISESLSLGESSVAIAQNGAETVTDLLTDMKEKIVAAQGENVDRTKLQADVDAITDQIESIVGAAQFNGLNMLQGTDDVQVLSSLDRASDGTVTSANITVARQDLSFDAGVFGPATGTDLSANITFTAGADLDETGAGGAFSGVGNSMTLDLATAPAAADETYNLQIAGETVSFTTVAGALTVDDVRDGLTAAINAAGIEGITATNDNAGEIVIVNTRAFEDVFVESSGPTTTFDITAGGVSSGAGTTASGTVASRASDITFSTTAGVSEGDGYRVTVGGNNYDYVAGKNETFEDVARGLKTAIDGAGVAGLTTNVTEKNGAWTLELDTDSATAIVVTDDGRAGGEATGGLAGLDNIDVTSEDSVEAALANIETYINTTIDAAADFGSSQGRIENQAEFISNLTDSLKSGIGALVDADMEETSARLQALQVQQQLGVQSLSIANQSPQTILSLFQ